MIWPAFHLGIYTTMGTIYYREMVHCSVEERGQDSGVKMGLNSVFNTCLLYDLELLLPCWVFSCLQNGIVATLRVC